MCVREKQNTEEFEETERHILTSIRNFEEYAMILEFFFKINPLKALAEIYKEYQILTYSEKQDKKEQENIKDLKTKILDFLSKIHLELSATPREGMEDFFAKELKNIRLRIIQGGKGSEKEPVLK